MVRRAEGRSRAGTGRTRRRAAGARWPARLAVLAGAGVLLLGVLAPPVDANYGRISARVGCDRVVNWTASASSEGDAEDRTNTRVRVEYRPTAGQEPIGDWEDAGPQGRFDATNDFSFAGSFDLPAAADSVDLRVTPLTDWGPGGDGDPAGGPRFGRAQLPEGCAEQPVVANVVEDCENGGARVTVRNVGDAAARVTVAADGTPLRELDVPTDGSEELIVPLLEDRPSAVRVTAGDFVVSESTVGADCGVEGAAAVVVERCQGRQAVVYASLGEGGQGTLQVRIAGAVVHRADMEAGAVTQRTLELPPSGTTEVGVEVSGTTLALGDVGGCDGPVAGLVTCGTSGRPECGTGATAQVPPPPPPPPPASIELDEPTLPRTGPWERAIVLLLGGGLLLAGGLASITRERTRPRPSPVATALAPYRQRWWDDDTSGH